MIRRYVEISRRFPPDFVVTDVRNVFHHNNTIEDLEKMIADNEYGSTYRWLDNGTLEETNYDGQGNVSSIIEYRLLTWSEHQFRR